jgi:hypothetical protein
MRITRWISGFGSPRLLLTAALTGAFFLAIAGEGRSEPAAGDETQVLAADTALGEALRAEDKGAVRRLLTLQFTYADARGRIYERKEFLSDLKAVAASAATGVKVAVYGGVAAVTGERKSAGDSDTFFLDIWAKQKGAWRALTFQDVALNNDQAPAAPEGAGASATPKNSSECQNPCETIPYRVRSPAEQDIVTAFQDIEKATVAHDAEAWGKHVGDDFVLYRSGHAPSAKAVDLATIALQKKNDSPVMVSEIETMRLSVYGDGAAMIAIHAPASRPPYRAASVWDRRNGDWQLVMAVETEIAGR